MSKKTSLIIKILLFPVVFYVLCLVVAFFFRDDAHAYSRVLMHELHDQDKIDVLFCGASHVSHGLLPSLMDEKINGGGYKTFCAGTPSQGIFETYAIIQDAVSFYDIKEIFLEIDFAIACSTPESRKSASSKNKYLATHYLKNPRVKIKHVLESTDPAYLLNEFLPIGMEQLINLNPEVFFRNLTSKISGEYYQYIYKDESADYMGKGCVFDHEVIENGTFFSRGVGPINVESINDNYKNIVRDIIELCKRKNIELVFYAQSNSDFYLCEKGNYDEFHDYIDDFLSSESCRFYDFNLSKEEFLSFDDIDFSDDNHLNGSGIIKFTNAFCVFYDSDDKDSFFYKTYAEKLNAQESKILGLSLREASDKKSVKIVPILNNGDVAKVSYTVNANFDDGKCESIFENSHEDTVVYPENYSGELEIRAYYDGFEHCHIKVPFVSM